MGISSHVMRSEGRSWQEIVGVSLLGVLLIVSLALLFLTEQSYAAFKATLQGIQFAVQLTDVEQVAPQQAHLRWIITVTIPNPKIPASLELLDWHLRSVDGSMHLGYYTTGEIQVALASLTEVPAEALIEGPNFEKLQRIQEASERALLFQGMARLRFRLPRGEESKIIPVEGIFTLPEGEE
jgi:predicted metal-dependent TIM-barrel fold hydrolase